MNQYNHLLVDKINKKVAIVTVNRHQARNALNSDLVIELTDALNELNNVDEISAVIITGDEEAFIAGADIKEMIGISVSQAFKIATRMKALHNIMIKSPKPFIAAINGYCLGAGLELALACDIRVAGPTAKFGLPEINLGVIPGGGGITRLSEITGTTIASKMIFTGEIISASKALELNIISDIFDDALKGAILQANTLTSKSNIAIAAAKRLINEKSLQMNDVHLLREIHEFSLLFDYPDSVEGMGAFIEKRAPIFKS